MSSVSFNTRFIEANFGDSISQAGASDAIGMQDDYTTSGHAMMMDLGQLTQELQRRSAKVQSLQQDKLKLKQLLLKAKTALDGLNAKFKGSQEALRSLG